MAPVPLEDSVCCHTSVCAFFDSLSFLYSLLLALARTLSLPGFGFGIRSSPEPGVHLSKQDEMSSNKEKEIERSMRELEAKKMRQKELEGRIQELTKDEQK